MTQPKLINNGWLTVPWAEYVGSDNPGPTDQALSWETGNQAVMTIQVYWADTPQACRDLLGTMQPLKFASPQMWTRTLPAPFPGNTPATLYASKITSIKPYKLIGKEGSLVVGPGGVANRAQYTYNLITVIFTTPRYPMYSDGDLDRIFGAPRAEWMRFCSFRPQLNTEILNRDQGSFWWRKEGASDGPPDGSEFTGSLFQVLKKIQYELVWYRVPRYGLFDSNGIPSGMIGTNTTGAWCVNSVAGSGIFNQTAGTLLMGNPRFEEVEEPDSFNTFNGNSVAYNVHIPITQFDPPQGGTTRGHNLAPWPGPTPPTGLNANTGKWFLVNTKGDGSGSNIYPSTDLRNIFVPVF